MNHKTPKKKDTKKKTSDKIKRSIPVRKLTSNLCVWYPNMLSRIKSFHHKKEIIKTIRNGTKTIKNPSFILMNITVFLIVENKAIETKIGQNEVWTAKKGLKNKTQHKTNKYS